MYQEVSYDTHHSLLSTLVMGGVITCGYHLFGTLTGGVCLHSCFQMALCAGTFTYTIWFIQKRAARKWIVICAFQGNYNPFLADDVKNYTSGQVIMADPAAYLSLWLHKGLQTPGTYVKAFLDNTYQAWYPGTSIVDNLQGEIYYFDFNGRNYLPTSTISPTLTHFYRKISLESFYQKLPVIRLLFSIGAMFWVAVITFFYGIQMKQPKIWQTWLFVFALCLTVFLGPISLVRYYLILFYILPVSILLLFGATEQTQRKG